MKNTTDVVKDPAGPAPLFDQLKEILPSSGRTVEGEYNYQRAKEMKKLKSLSSEPILVKFAHWRIIENAYPYDMIFSTHHLLIPKRQFADRRDINENERRELQDIVFRYIEDNYDGVIDNTTKRRSIHVLYHLHLFKWHQNRTDFKL